jgi:hypothetical protein
MDYGGLLTKAWNTVWNHKFLIGLGVLVALGTGGGGGPRSGGGSSSSGGGGGNGGSLTPGSGADVCASMNQGFRSIGAEGTAIIGVVLFLLCIGMLIGLVFWVIGRIAEGGLINGVDEIENGRPTGFVAAWSAGWKNVWRLVGIGAIAGIPGILIFVVILIMGYMIVAGTDWQAACLALSSNDPQRIAGVFGTLGTAGIIALVVCCPLTLVSYVLSAVRAFADRACMTENLGVLDAYSRGWEVLRSNLGQVVILFLIQIALGIGVGILLFVPSFLIALCCLLWPILWLISGTLQAYFSTLWTLGWRQWVGAKPVGEPPSPTPAPAV